MEEYASIRERWREYQPSKAMWLWSCGACIVGTVMVGFGWGGWVTESSTSRLVANARLDTRDRIAAAICVARFEVAPNAPEALATLKKTDILKRTGFIAKGGWLIVPGSEGPLSDAAEMCVEKLLMAKLPVNKPPITKASASAVLPAHVGP